MNKQAGITRTDLLAVIVCGVLIVANAQIISAGGRGRAKRQVCLSNLRSLTAAWHAYADDNAGKIVNGFNTYPGGYCPGCPYQCAALAPTGSDPLSSFHRSERPWVGYTWRYSDIPKPECCQKCAIETGALYKYIKDYNIYSCPAGMEGEWVTYAVIDSMNGEYYYSSDPPGDGFLRSLVVKNKSRIVSPAKRVVFIDNGKQSRYSFAVFYNKPEWLAPPPVRHGKGTTVSYADGHSEYWKWQGTRTIECGEEGGYYCPVPSGSSCEDYQDLYRMQMSCWGQIGYDLQAIAGPDCPLVWE